MKKILRTKAEPISPKLGGSSTTKGVRIVKDVRMANSNYKGKPAKTTTVSDYNEDSLDKYYSQIFSKWAEDLRCPWTDELIENLSGFLKLKKGWDGYDGKEITKKTLKEVTKLLRHLYQPKIKAPSVAPNGEGSMIMDWFYSDFEIMICVNGDGEVEGCLKNLKYGVGDNRRYDECEGKNIEKCLPQIKKWFSKVS